MTAIYDHHLPPDVTIPDEAAAVRSTLTEIMLCKVIAALPEQAVAKAPRFGGLRFAKVHGHCLIALNGTFAMMGEAEPLETTLSGVLESLASAH